MPIPYMADEEENETGQLRMTELEARERTEQCVQRMVTTKVEKKRKRQHEPHVFVDRRKTCASFVAKRYHEPEEYTQDAATIWCAMNASAGGSDTARSACTAEKSGKRRKSDEQAKRGI